jgi:hypothetical protein
VEVRHINRSSSATLQPKVDTSTIVMSQVIADRFFKERSRIQAALEPPGPAGQIEREPSSAGNGGRPPRL